MRNENNSRLSDILIDWYDDNKRDLPWRNTTDPYKIWLSEIILQQTRVDQGRSYFDKFIKIYPSVDLLAKASEEDVLKLWQGLGYYSRARNLHATAKMVVDCFKGVFPYEYKDVLSLKGVGEYTAAAIVSFSYNQPYAVVDGNVYRVLSRIFAVEDAIDKSKGQKVFKELATLLLDRKTPGLYNQSIMEFGALQCVPMSPNCAECPASGMCLAHAQGKVSLYPIKKGKAKNRIRYFHYFDIRNGDNMYIHKRIGKDIWQGLYELPLIETETDLSIVSLQQSENFKKLFSNQELIIRYVTRMKHILSHQTIFATFYRVDMSGCNLEGDYLNIKSENIDVYPVSRLIHKYLETL